MKVTIPIEAANKAVREGTVKEIMKTTLETLRPEASYFFPSEEGRTMLFFVDVKEPSDLPRLGEALYQGLSGRISYTPVMNLEDFQAGLAKLAR
jgi:hypothetical protein